MRKNIFTAFFLLIHILCYSQEKGSIEIIWEKTYGGKKNEFPNSIVSTENEDILIVGSQQKENGFDTNVLVLRIDKEGKEIWRLNYGDNQAEIGYDVLELNDNSILVVGTVKINNNTDIQLLNLNAKGELLWKKQYEEPYNVLPKDIIKTRNGTILISGMQEIKEETGKIIQHAFIKEVDLQGNEIRTQTYVSKTFIEKEVGKTGKMNQKGEGANTIYQTKDGGFLMGGYSMSNAKEGLGTDGWISKTNSEGVEQWNSVFGEIGGDQILAVSEDDQGNLIISGTRYHKPQPFLISLWFLKFDSAGNMLHEKYFNDGNICIGGKSLVIDANNILLIGSSNNSKKEWIKIDTISNKQKDILLEKGWETKRYNESTFLENDNSKTGLKRINEDNYIVLCNSEGHLKLQKSFGGAKDDKLIALCKTQNNEIFITGYTYSKGEGLKDISLFRLKMK